jgi:hypothetical protein
MFDKLREKLDEIESEINIFNRMFAEFATCHPESWMAKILPEQINEQEKNILNLKKEFVELAKEIF